MKSNKSIAISLGILSALFFAVTFVLNRLISIEGGYWIWSASLRFFWMLPLLFMLVVFNNDLKPLLSEMKKKPWHWILWSTVGFGVFYAPLTFAANFGPSWLVASTWQITIVAGMLISPIINRRSFKDAIPLQTLVFSLIIVSGVLMMQINQSKLISGNELLMGVVPVLIAAFAYPLGNRKMMQVTGGNLNATQRTLGMTIASMPFWVLLSVYGVSINRLPNESQFYQTLIVAICSGVVATVLFFKATDRVHKDEKTLASVEATQSTEVLFALVGELVILKVHLPDTYSTLGIVLVITGMILHSLKKEN